MGSPVIQILLNGRLVQTVPFQGDELSIGRMKENDIVINNLSVSRFHAVLRRKGGQLILEDPGSENGCYVNGIRIARSVVLEPGDEVLIGKHQLVLSEADGAQEASSQAKPRARSDAWDASETYFVDAEPQTEPREESASAPLAVLNLDDEEELFPDDQAGAQAATAPPRAGEAIAVDASIEAEPAQLESEPPVAIDVASEKQGLLVPPASDGAEEGGPNEETEKPASPSEIRDDDPFEFGREGDLAGAELSVDPHDYDVDPIDEEPAPAHAGREASVETVEPGCGEAQSTGNESGYAGLIIQNQRKLESIISWDEDRLTAGRSQECEIFLDQPEISRRHAMFVREGEHYEVRDLESINGILVNGEKVQRRRLEVGDVVKIENFELTFLLDRQPIASEIKTDQLGVPLATPAESRFNMTMIDENLPPGSAISDADVREESVAKLEVEEPSVAAVEPFDDEQAGEKALVDFEALAEAALELEDPMRPVVDGDVVTLELKIRVADLPEPLRRALADVDGRDLRLPIQIALKLDR